MRKAIFIPICAALLMLAISGDSLAATAGGRSGARSGGGFHASRGSVRYSGKAPRANAPSQQRTTRNPRTTAKSSTPVRRSSTGTVQRSRSNTPTARYSNTSSRQPNTAVERRSGSNYNRRPNTTVAQRPSNYGSILNKPAQPIQTPIGGGTDRVEGPIQGQGVVGRGSGGYGSAAVRGPEGGAGRVVKGPYGHRSYVRPPEGARRILWHGGSYWNMGAIWYRPYYYGGTVYYSEVPPPTGYVMEELPAKPIPMVLDGITYYFLDGTYYLLKDGKYEVVDPPNEEETDEIEEEALAQLQRMADFLGTVKAGRVTVRDASDEILDSGQKVQVETRRTIAVRSPDRMAIDYAATGVTRRVVYDGKTITIYEKEQNLYTQQDMPPTTSEALDLLASQYGMAVPAVELLRPSLMDKLEPQLRAAVYLGTETVEGVRCHALSLGLDWADVMLWIQEGDQPLLRRVVISYREILGTPKYTMDFQDWDFTNPPDSAFLIEVPDNAERIEMTPLAEKE